VVPLRAICFHAWLTSAPTASIKNAAATVAYDLMSNYNGNLTGNEVGVLPVDPVHYYWWEAGGMWGSMRDFFQGWPAGTDADSNDQLLVFDW
jgi:mannan endo-1,6-alpha-mannosidase